MEFEFYQFDTLGDYKFADIVASYEGKWIFCKHKNRTTWEIPGGILSMEKLLWKPLKENCMKKLEQSVLISYHSATAHQKVY